MASRRKWPKMFQSRRLVVLFAILVSTPGRQTLKTSTCWAINIKINFEIACSKASADVQLFLKQCAPWISIQNVWKSGFHQFWIVFVSINLLATRDFEALQQPTEDVAPLFRVLCPSAHAVPLFRFHVPQGPFYTPGGLTMGCYRWDDRWFTTICWLLVEEIRGLSCSFFARSPANLGFWSQNHVVGSLGKMNDLLELGV